jgi:hypothetical protein
MNPKQITQILGVSVLVVIIFIFGFYLGYKNRDSKVESTTSNTNTVQANPTTISSPEKVDNQNQTTTPSNQGVFWIKVGENPVCPENYPVKGKFDSSSAMFYYTTDNKSYDRVKPDICFTSEDFASNTAGFIKKF